MVCATITLKEIVDDDGAIDSIIPGLGNDNLIIIIIVVALIALFLSLR